jgi:anti-sigma B factor antagonist
MVRIDERAVGDVTILDVKGDMTLGDGRLPALIQDLVQRGRRKVVLSLEDLEYVDSSGIGDLVGAFAILRRNGGELLLHSISKRLDDLFAITKLGTVFSQMATLDEVVAALGERPILAQCPVCREEVRYFASAEFQRCATCDTGFKLSLPSATDGTGEVVVLRLPTYDNEYIEVVRGVPWRIAICGRLDLFSLEIVEKAWRVVPDPTRVVLAIDGSRKQSDRGWEAFWVMVRQSRAVVAIAVVNMKDEERKAIKGELPIHDSEGSAAASLKLTSTSPPATLLIPVRIKP